MAYVDCGAGTIADDERVRMLHLFQVAAHWLYFRAPHDADELYEGQMEFAARALERDNRVCPVWLPNPDRPRL